MAEKREQGDLKNFTEEAALERLKRLGIEGVEFAFLIDDEKTLQGEAIEAEVTWVKIPKPEGVEFEDLAEVEGKLYFPPKPNGELILFTPGFPGGNAGRFEQRYAKTFVDAGIAFFTVRHNGTSLTNGATSMEILNSAKRMELAQRAGEGHIGGTKPEGYSPFAIVDEPIVPFMALQDKFRRIHLMGQSMGVTASYNTVRRLAGHPEFLAKIGNVVGIAGYVGKEHDGPVWDGMSMPMDELTDYEYEYVKKVGANIVPKEQFQQEMAKAAEANKALTMPGHIGNILIHTPGDPLIAGPDKSREEYALNYGPISKRKLIIRDESNLTDPKQHSMLWIAPENLLRAVRTQVSEYGPHYIKLPKSRDVGLVEKG